MSLEFANQPHNSQELIYRAENLLEQIAVTRPNSFQFKYDDIEFRMLRSQRGEDLYTLYGVIGHLPYTAEDSDKRQQLLSVLEASKRLGAKIKFVVDKKQQILVLSEMSPGNPVKAIDMCHQIVDYTTKARPFWRLFRTVMQDKH